MLLHIYYTVFLFSLLDEISELNCLVLSLLSDTEVNLKKGAQTNICLSEEKGTKHWKKRCGCRIPYLDHERNRSERNPTTLGVIPLKDWAVFLFEDNNVEKNEANPIKSPEIYHPVPCNSMKTNLKLFEMNDNKFNNNIYNNKCTKNYI